MQTSRCSVGLSGFTSIGLKLESWRGIVRIVASSAINLSVRTEQVREFRRTSSTGNAILTALDPNPLN